MYAGHYAVGLALSARAKTVPPRLVLFGIGFIDILFGLFTLTGIDRISPAPSEPLGFALDFVDWDHSLLMTALWSIAYGVAFGRRGAAAVVGGLAVFSHFLCDVLMHNGDLALYPHSEKHFGFFLWHDYPVGSWFIEGAFTLALLGFFVAAMRKEGATLKDALKPVIVVLVLHVSFAPALSPLKVAVASLAPHTAEMLAAVLTTIGFVVPPFIIERLMPKATQRAATSLAA